jgi:hypothetical protein
MHVELLPRSIWVVRFIHELTRLGSSIDPSLLADRGAELWDHQSDRKPEDAALDELAAWPSVSDRVQ